MAKVGCEGFSKIKDTPKDSFAPHAREDFFVGVSSERSKTILVLKTNDGVIELEPVTSYAKMSDDDPEPQVEEKDFDVHEDGICNVLRDSDQQQQDEFFDCNEGDESDDFDVVTFHPVVKNAGATIVSAKDVEKSSGARREEWRSAIHNGTCGLHRKRERHNCQSGHADFEFAWFVCDRSGYEKLLFCTHRLTVRMISM